MKIKVIQPVASPTTPSVMAPSVPGAQLTQTPTSAGGPLENNPLVVPAPQTYLFSCTYTN